jgi:hypothetical protein
VAAEAERPGWEAETPEPEGRAVEVFRRECLRECPKVRVKGCLKVALAEE